MSGETGRGCRMRFHWLKWLFGAGVAMEVFSSIYFFYMAFSRKRLPGVPKPDFLSHGNDDWREYQERSREGEEWLRSQQTEELSILSCDGLRLFGTLLRAPKETGKTILAVHGYRGSAMRFFAISARFYHEMGYNILFVDDRAHGRSEGDFIGFGWKDRLDIGSWCEYLVKFLGEDVRIALLGISMGGAAVMMAAGEELPEQVRCIMEDCGFLTVWNQFVDVFPKKVLLPKNLTVGLASLYSRCVQGYGFREASAFRQLSKNKRPVLFIHGDADDFVPVQSVYDAYRATAGPARMLVVEQAGHALSYLKDTEGYERAVREFLDSYL